MKLLDKRGEYSQCGNGGLAKAKGKAASSKTAGGGGGEELTPVLGYNATTDNELNSWQDEAYKIIKQNPSLTRIDDVEAAKNLANSISFYAKQNPGDFIGIRDKTGILQAASLIKSDGKSLHISLLATAPWNISRNDARSVRGAGTAAIEAAIKESIKRGHKGRVYLEALPNAIPFYEKVGFKSVHKQEDSFFVINPMILSPQKAKEFLNKMEAARS